MVCRGAEWFAPGKDKRGDKDVGIGSSAKHSAPIRVVFRPVFGNQAVNVVDSVGTLEKSA